MQQFRGGLVFEAHRLLYHSTLGLRVLKKKKHCVPPSTWHTGEIQACLARKEKHFPRTHPGGNPGANLKSISHRCHPILVAFVWELTKETIHLPLGCLQGGLQSAST